MKDGICRLTKIAIVIGSIGMISTSAFSAGTPEQRRACEADAYRICRDVIPDVHKITECMHKNQKKLSPACKAFFKPS
jgi:hypothetical protein